MRSLILGATGLIGSHITAAAADRRFPSLGTWYRRPHADHHPLDLRDAEAVDDLIADYQPDVTFLAAGLGSPGYAESHPDESRELTADGACRVARGVAAHGGLMVLFSPDAVVGDCPSARREDDPVCPRGVWAADHARAEVAVRANLPGRHLIVRTSWVFGPDDRQRGPAGRVARRLGAGDPVEAATDRYGQPTFAPDLADAVFELLKVGTTGTVHVVGPERHTEFTFARLAARVFGHDTDLIRGMTAADLADGDPRPNRVWLDRHTLRTALGARAIRSPADGLRAVRDGRAAPSRLAVYAA